MAERRFAGGRDFNKTVRTMELKLYNTPMPREGISGHAPLDKELAFLDVLSDCGIAYEWVAHDPLATMEDCLAVDAVFGFQICKNLFLCNQQKTVFYLLLMPADKPFKTKYLSKELGIARLSFADEGKLLEYLNLTPGSVSAAGLIFDPEHKVRLLIDRALLCEERFGCHPAINTATVAFSTADLIEKYIPHVGHIPTYVDLIPTEA